MGGRKERSAIDAVATLVHTVQERWKEKNIAATLLMNIKGAFDHVSRGRLITRMIKFEIDGDSMTWTAFFFDQPNDTAGD